MFTIVNASLIIVTTAVTIVTTAVTVVTTAVAISSGENSWFVVCCRINNGIWLWLSEGMWGVSGGVSS